VATVKIKPSRSKRKETQTLRMKILYLPLLQEFEYSSGESEREYGGRIEGEGSIDAVYWCEKDTVSPKPKFYRNGGLQHFNGFS
jgi:hypothetical protein